MPYDEDDMLAAVADLYDGPCGDMVVPPPLSASEEALYPSLFPENGDVKPAEVPPLNSSLCTGGDGYGDDVFPAPLRCKRQRTTSSPTPRAVEFVEEDELRRKAASACKESRGFHKLWTVADEITILEGFLEFTSRRGTAHADYQHDTGPFCDQIKGRLQFDFSRNQIVEKLRRLKKKYRNMAAHMAGDGRFIFRSAHDRAIFDIASKIWNPTFKRANRPQDAFEGLETPNPPKSFHLYDASEAALFDSAASQESSFDSEAIANLDPPLKEPEPAEEESILPHLTASLEEIMKATACTAATMHASVPEQCAALPSLTARPEAVAIENTAEQTDTSCLLASFVELMQNSAFGGGIGNHSSSLVGNHSNVAPSSKLGQKWKQQQILELEVYLKRLDLVYEQVSLKLEKLRSREEQTAGGQNIL